jgi:hypothetical protein
MKMTKRDLILLSVLGVVAILGGFWWFVAKPAKAELSAQNDQLAQIQTESNDLKDTLSRMSVSTNRQRTR